MDMRVKNKSDNFKSGLADGEKSSSKKLKVSRIEFLTRERGSNRLAALSVRREKNSKTLFIVLKIKENQEWQLR
jgi:hypothetical protein